MQQHELKVYRRSELQTIDEGCLHRYNLLWRQGLDDTSDLALVGIAFHKIKHRYILRLLEHQTPADAEEAREAFTEGIAASNTPPRLIPECRELWDFHAESFALPLERFLAAEERQTSGQVSWSPDLVLVHPETNELEIKDDKSGWSPPPTEDVLKKLFQARVYSFYGISRWPNFSSYRFTINAVRWNKSTSVVFSPAELDNVQRELEALIATKEEAERLNEWPAIPGPSCTYCQLACPLEAPALIPKRIQTMTQRQQIAGYALAMEAQLRTIKKLLKADVTANGPIDIRGIEFANRPVTSKAYPVDALMKVLESRNLMGAFDNSAAQGLTISQSALSKLFRAYPMLEADLASVVQSKETYRFSARKPGGDDDEEG